MRQLPDPESAASIKFGPVCTCDRPDVSGLHVHVRHVACDYWETLRFLDPQTRTQWGVSYDEGKVTTYGVTPNGDYAEYDEDTARYLSRYVGKAVHREVTTYRETHTEWEDAE